MNVRRTQLQVSLALPTHAWLASFACRLTLPSRPYGRFVLPGQNVEAREHVVAIEAQRSSPSLWLRRAPSRVPSQRCLCCSCVRVANVDLFGDGVIGCDRGVHGGHNGVVCMAM